MHTYCDEARLCRRSPKDTSCDHPKCYGKKYHVTSCPKFVKCTGGWWHPIDGNGYHNICGSTRCYINHRHALDNPELLPEQALKILKRACKNDDLPVVKRIFATTNLTKDTLLGKDGGKEQLPPLCYAIMRWKTDFSVVRWLVKEQGADVNARIVYRFGWGTALIAAALEGLNEGSVELVKWLVEEANAEVDARDSGGSTALMRASEEAYMWPDGSGIQNYNDMISYLVVECRSDYTLMDKKGRTAHNTRALRRAIRRRKQDIRVCIVYWLYFKFCNLSNAYHHYFRSCIVCVHAVHSCVVTHMKIMQLMPYSR